MTDDWTTIKGALLEAAAERRTSNAIFDHEMAAEYERIAEAPQPGTVDEVEDELRGTFCARRAGAMLALAYDNDDPQTMLRDVLTDLLHYTDAQELDWYDALSSGFGSYEAERLDDRRVVEARDE